MGEYEIEVVTVYRIKAANTEAAEESITAILDRTEPPRNPYAPRTNRYIKSIRQADGQPPVNRIEDNAQAQPRPLRASAVAICWATEKRRRRSNV